MESMSESEKLHDQYGLPREEMDKFLKDYHPDRVISRRCPSCKTSTDHEFIEFSRSEFERYRWFKKISTQVIYLTYSCTRCHNSETFPEIRVRPERRGKPLENIVSQESAD